MSKVAGVNTSFSQREAAIRQREQALLVYTIILLESGEWSSILREASASAPPLLKQNLKSSTPLTARQPISCTSQTERPPQIPPPASHSGQMIFLPEHQRALLQDFSARTSMPAQVPSSFQHCKMVLLPRRCESTRQTSVSAPQPPGLLLVSPGLWE